MEIEDFLNGELPVDIDNQKLLMQLLQMADYNNFLLTRILTVVFELRQVSVGMTDGETIDKFVQTIIEQERPTLLEETNTMFLQQIRLAVK